ncbi:hypothetical protein G9A89_015592 [Geosiphon pyriformis]|nr:hypothetical protein G9A89_015592 [Geosiphon pyriformis]
MGSCVSSQENNTSQNQSKKINHFHESTFVGGAPGGQTVKTRVMKRPRKKVHKGLISLPTNFQHTGHIGIAEMRSGKVDPEKIRNQMAEVAAALRVELMKVEENKTKPESSGELKNQVSRSNSIASSIHNPNDPKFKIKRKPTLTSGSHSRDTSSSTTESVLKDSQTPPLDPMAEIVAALKMPSDMNFGIETSETTMIM